MCLCLYLSLAPCFDDCACASVCIYGLCMQKCSRLHPYLPQQARSCCNDSPYHVVIANIPASTQLVQNHTLFVKCSFAESKRFPPEKNVGMMIFQLYIGVYVISTASIIYFIRSFMFSVERQFSSSFLRVFFFKDFGTINHQRVLTTCL